MSASIRISRRLRLTLQAVLLGGLILGLPARSLAREETIRIDESVLAEETGAMKFPYRQLMDLADQERGKSFSLSEYTILKHRNSGNNRSARHFLKSADGKNLLELRSDTGIYSFNPKYASYTATSNQPAQGSGFYLLLKANCIREKSGITRADLRKVFDDYKDFADQQLAMAKKYYGATKKDDLRGIRQVVTPDEIIIFLHTEELARELATQTNTVAEGKAVRITERRLDALTTTRAPDLFAKLHADAIECITPWRQLEALPDVRDGAALFIVGWISFRTNADAPQKEDLIMLGMLARK